MTRTEVSIPRAHHASGVARLTGVLIAAALPAAPALAHHAFTAQYDAEQPVSITGIVVKIEWLNPHAYFFVDVEDQDSGDVVTWASEMGSPVVLMRQGWSRNSLKIGDVVAIDGIKARDGSASLNARSVVLADTGERLFTRSAAEERQVEDPPQSGGAP
jgi:hypothetical protein